MGARFERFKARVNNQPEPVVSDECDIEVLLEDMHEMFHDMLEISQEDMTNERWTEIVDAANEQALLYPDFTNAEIGVMLFLMLKDFRDTMFETD